MYFFLDPISTGTGWYGRGRDLLIILSEYFWRYSLITSWSFDLVFHQIRDNNFLISALLSLWEIRSKVELSSIIPLSRKSRKKSNPDMIEDNQSNLAN